MPVKQEPTAPKHTKAEVYYRVAEDPAQSCGVCRYFRKRANYDNGACVIVRGLIEPEDTCDLWEAPTLAEAASLPLLGIAGALLIFGIMSSRR